MKTYLSVQELADYLKISKPTIYRLTSEKRIPHLKFGGRVIFDIEAVDTWAAGKLVEVGAADERG